MFHVEHNLYDLSQKTGINEPDIIHILLNYAEMIFNENRKFNLTGHKSLKDIIINLIIKSLEPFKSMDVPRGTLFADLGTGAGIPGVPLAVKYPWISGILFDSIQKKIDFIEKVKEILKLENIKTVGLRIEDAGRSSEFRERFDLVITRAMSDLYTIAELSSPLLKPGGYLYAYTNLKIEDINNYIYGHLHNLGLKIKKKTDDGSSFLKLCKDGLLFEKVNHIDEKYPRRMAVIKRMAERNEI